MASLIYKNMTIYRAVMQVLYTGRYHQRFDPVKKILLEKKCASLLEICFGDTVVADFCKKNGITWKGFDGNEKFVERARKKGFKAEKKSIDSNTDFPKTDAVLLMGSLYHFEKDVIPLLLSLFSSTHVFVLNEPVNNLSQKKITSRLAGKLSDAGKGPEYFRYTKAGLLKLAQEICELVPFSFYIAEEGKKDITLVFERR